MARWLWFVARMSSSRSGSVPAFDINGDVDRVLLPDYVEPIVHLTFANDTLFKEWFLSTAQKHATFLKHKETILKRSTGLSDHVLLCPLPVL